MRLKVGQEGGDQETGAVGRKGGPHGRWGESRSQGNQGDQLGRVGRQRGTGPDGRRSCWEDGKKAKDQEVGVNTREGGSARPPGQRPQWCQHHNGNDDNNARAMSAMRTAQCLHQHQQDAGNDASGNFAEEGKFAR